MGLLLKPFKFATKQYHVCVKILKINSFIKFLKSLEKVYFLKNSHENSVKIENKFNIFELKFEFVVNFHVRKHIFKLLNLNFYLKNKCFIIYYFIA